MNSFLKAGDPMTQDGLWLADQLDTLTGADLVAALRGGLFDELVPGIGRLAGCDQGSLFHFEGDAAVHTGMVFDAVVANAPHRLSRHADFIERLAALIHDWKKPDTRTPFPNGGVSFPGHEVLAADHVPALAGRIGLADGEQERLRFLVGRHGDANIFPSLPAELQRQLVQSEYARSLALLQEADALSCYLDPAGVRRLPVYWDLLVSRA